MIKHKNNINIKFLESLKHSVVYNIGRKYVLLVILSIFRLPLFATTPWSIIDDFSGSVLSDKWDNFDDLTDLDVWPDGRTGNKTLLNNKLSYIANDDAEQNGLIYLRPHLLLAAIHLT